MNHENAIHRRTYTKPEKRECEKCAVEPEC